MNTFVAQARQMLVPYADPKHGPLPPLLVSMTLVSGLVDAVSYQVLGQIFVANMTGNVVFLALIPIGAAGISAYASLVALGAFFLGGLYGGILGSRLGRHRGRLLIVAAAFQASFLAIATGLAAVSGNPVSLGYRYVLIVVLAMAMGLQTATARRLAVPDLTTVVLTLTIAGTAADSGIAGGGGSKAGRRLIPLAAMLLGSLVSSSLIIQGSIVAPLAIAFVVIAMVAATAWVLSGPKSGRDQSWVQGG